MLIQSREYKVMMDVSLLADPADGLAAVLEDLGTLASSLSLKIQGKFSTNEAKERTIRFLDTPEYTLRDNSLLLRQRKKRRSGKTSYTLKCRTEDRYIAAGQDLSVGLGEADEPKFEEDIGVPFVSRFSKSQDTALGADEKFGGDDFPKTLGEAAKLYPAIGKVTRGGLVCPPETTLAFVNGITAYERVFAGPSLLLGTGKKATPAEIAVVLWTSGWNEQPLTAEFSFRYSHDKEAFPASVAQAARSFFLKLQRLDWSRPDSITKTQFIYKE